MFFHWGDAARHSRRHLEVHLTQRERLFSFGLPVSLIYRSTHGRFLRFFRH
jgi:hypothetical protein